MDASFEPIPMLDLATEVDELWDDLQVAIGRVLRSGRFVLGPEVDAFEREAAAYLGVRHAVGLNSGTDALVIGLRAMGLGAGDEVITSAYSFFATAESIALAGATPVFADIRLDTLNLDPDAVAAAVTPRTRAIVPVHLFGRPAEMDRIMEVAEAHGLKVLEDCAQAFGASVPACVPAGGGPAAATDPAREAAGPSPRKAGAIGDAGAFSFYPTKNLGAYGDGGMLATDNEDVALRARMLRGHGASPDARYLHHALGYNSRLDEIQAAVLRLKLPRVDADNDMRRAIARRYTDAFEGHARIVAPAVRAGDVFHQYAALVPADARDRIREALDEQGIATAAFYPRTLAASFAEATGGSADAYPVSQEASDRVLNLPIWPGLTGRAIDRVAAAVTDAVNALA